MGTNVDVDQNRHGRPMSAVSSTDKEPIAVAKRPTGISTPGRRNPNRLWLAAGVLIVAIAGLSSYLLFNASTARVSVLAAAEPIEAGERIERSNIRIVDVLPATAATAIPLAVYAENPDAILGQRASHALSEGAVLQPLSLFAVGLEDTPVILGADLVPGQYPLPGLNVGDRVSIIILSTDGDDEFSLGAERYTEAKIVGVQELNANAGDVFVSLELQESEATAVAAALAQSRVRLGLVGYES